MLIKNISVKGTVIKIGDAEVHILDIANKTVRLGIDAPKSSRITTQSADSYLRGDMDGEKIHPPYPPNRKDIDPSGL